MRVATNPRQQLLALKQVIAAEFTAEHWLELGVVTDCSDLVRGHPRLLRSMQFGDSDYSGAALDVLLGIVARGPDNLAVIAQYVADHVRGESVSSVPTTGRQIVFAPTVFAVPEGTPDATLVSAMMPFDAAFRVVHETIKAACASVGLTCARADDIWEHSTVIQDVFSLIFRSYIVVCDFTGRNTNVFYEAGIAHTLGKHVIPITQVADDVPFDLRHHRFVRYLNNGEGLTKLRADLEERLRYLTSTR